MADDENDADAALATAPSERDALLGLLDEGIQEAHRKATSGRVYDAENEKVRQGWFRTLGYLAGQYRQLKRDQDLEELAEKVEQIEERQQS